MNADLIERLRRQGRMETLAPMMVKSDSICWQAADALEQLERKCAEQALEISTMKLVIKKMEARRK